MTNIVSLLESDETFAEIVEKILREAERYLCTSHAAVLQVSTDGKLINTVISYAGEGELPLKINNIPKSKFLIGSDELKCCATGRCSEEEKYAVSIYNIILGGSANSKLFQNVREKASLAYTAGSNYLRQKNNILIRCGIEIQNYQKAVEIIKQQLKDMEEEKFNEDDINNAKNIIISTVDGIEDSQDSEISYYFSQELTSNFVSIKDYIKNINKVTKENVVTIAKKIKINTIYFLKNN